MSNTGKKRAKSGKSASDEQILTDYEVVASLQTDVGCVRETNEDNGRFVKPNDPQLIAAKGMLALVCDGMGGHSSGEVASQMAVDSISSLYYQSAQTDTQLALRAALEAANREIYAVSQTDETKRGMGTTCTALVVREGQAYAAHVGDSRMYLVRDGAAHLLTQDHSMVMEMVKQGILTMEKARHHEDKNVITRALGTQAEVEVDTWAKPFPVRENDSFLLCSDGLYDLIEDDEIREAVTSSKDAYEACEALIALAKERGGHDNITVCIVQIKPVGENEAAPPSLPVTRELEVSL
jgi:serine/threonine protein phosphatase PrpC